MIELENVTKAYPLGRETVTALDRVSLTVGAGEYAAIIGPSGSGKSTLMHILGCLDRPTSGTYRLHGRDVSTLSAEELAHVRGEEIGFVFQGFQLLPQLTAVENVALPLLLSGVNRRQRLQRARGFATGPASCPADSSSGSPSPGRWYAIRRCFWRTSRPVTWTGTRPARYLPF